MKEDAEAVKSKPKFYKRGASLCNCEVCYEYKAKPNKSFHKRGRSEVKQLINLKQEPEGKQITFGELLEYLVSSKRNKGVPILIPETLVFNNKRITDFYKYNLATTELKLVKGPYIYPRILRIIMDGQKTRYRIKEHNKVIPIVIIYLKESFKLLTETEFAEFMLKRSGSDQWDDIEYIQSYIFDRYGLASSFVYEYESFLKTYNPKTTEFDSDESLKKASPIEYAKKLCTVLSYYLLKVHNIELLSAKITFMRDNKNDFWLTFASNIYIRRVEAIKARPNKFDLNYMRLGKLLETSSKNIHKANEIVKLMTSNFKAMKYKAGLKDIDVRLPDEFQIDKTFALLRPGSVYRLSEMISPQFNPKGILKQREEEGWTISKTDRELAEFVKPEEVRSMYLYKPYKLNEFIKRAKTSNSNEQVRRSLTISKYGRRGLGHLRVRMQSNESRKCITANISRVNSPTRLFY